MNENPWDEDYEDNLQSKNIAESLDNVKYEIQAREYTLSEDEMATVFYCRDLAQRTLMTMKLWKGNGLKKNRRNRKLMEIRSKNSIRKYYGKNSNDFQVFIDGRALNKKEFIKNGYVIENAK